jgi:hypothetical protein
MLLEDRGMAQVVEGLLNKLKALGSSPSTAKKKKGVLLLDAFFFEGRGENRVKMQGDYIQLEGLFL